MGGRGRLTVVGRPNPASGDDEVVGLREAARCFDSGWGRGLSAYIRILRAPRKNEDWSSHVVLLVGDNLYPLPT